MRRTQLLCPVKGVRTWMDDEEPAAGAGTIGTEDVPELPPMWGELRLVIVRENPEVARIAAMREAAEDQFEENLAAQGGLGGEAAEAVARRSFRAQLDQALPPPEELIAVEHRWSELSPAAVEAVIGALRAAGLPFSELVVEEPASEQAQGDMS